MPSKSKKSPRVKKTPSKSPKPPPPVAASITESSMEVEDSTAEDTPTKLPTNGSTPDDTTSPAAAADDDNNNDPTADDTAATPPKSATPKKKRKSVGTAAAMNKTYIQIILEAIIDMKDRTGSSLAAIKKWILTQYPDLAGPQFATRVNLALKNGLISKPHPKLVKVRASYKITKEYREATRNQKRRAATAKQSKAKAAKIKEMQQKKKQQLKEISPEEAKALRKKKKEQEAAAAAAKIRADRLRRRRFPMEDTKVHREDIELGVKPPPDVVARPYLPYFWHVTLPLTHPARTGKTSGSVLAASKVDGVEWDARGLVPDLLGVYHFFRGDIHFTMGTDKDSESSSSGGRRSSKGRKNAATNGIEEEEIVPDFTLQHLIYAVEQVQNGNTRKSKQVPPLLVHLFVTCLQILCQAAPTDGASGSSTPDEQQLHNDLHQYLLPALSPASWADVMYLYMDAMERFYNTDSSRDPNVLPPLETDLNYLFERTDVPVAVAPSTPGTSNTRSDESSAEDRNASVPLPAGYCGYLGDQRSPLAKAHQKLSRQDPWLLTAEELMALLRALTEDILASHPAASKDMAQREEQMNELNREKRAADLKFRKVRLAFEGPQKPSRPKAKPKEENGKPVEDTAKEEAPEAPFKPTATKKQFEAAQKAQEKANDAYEKGIRTLVARTEPVGVDRHFNPVYCFRHDPEVLYIEESRPASSSSSTKVPTDMLFQRYSWHVIETASLFDQFVASLDIRGRREHDLYEELVGPPGSHRALRRFLHDDVKAKTEAKAKIKEMESLKERLQIARVKCDEEQGRRSGRLAGQAEIELSQIQSEIDDLEKQAAGKKVPEKLEPSVRNYSELTGLDVLRKFELAGRVETRRTREKKAEARARQLPLMRCTKLMSTGNIDGTGMVGMLVSSMLDLEGHCESLAPWDRQDMTRSQWISRLEGAVPAWNSISQEALGAADLPNSRASLSAGTHASSPMDESNHSNRESLDPKGNAKKRKYDSPSTSAALSSSAPTTLTVSSIISMLKQPLLDLEARVADITNVALATRDADLADDNMSVTDTSAQDEANKERIERAWKKLVDKIQKTPTKRHALIRELLVSAIGAARKAHLQQVVSQLRAALLKYHPSAAFECKVAAIKILEEHGGYEADEDDDDEEEVEGTEQNQEDTVPSVLSAEAATLRGSLGGSADATREDWVAMVKSCKAISRIASLTSAFVVDALEKIEKLEFERDELTYAIQDWNKAEEKLVKQRENKKTVPIKEIKGPSEVWANVRYSDKMCMAKTEEYPWWPAKKCEAKDEQVAASLAKLNRSLVAFVGEMGSLRVVKTENLKPFDEQAVEEDVEYAKETRAQLDDCMAMARRIQRGLKKKKRKR